MQLPKVTIITATYNSAATVADTLKSVATQTYPNIEHLIIDGQSSDATLAIVNNYKHVATLVSERDKGIYDAMNKGLALATGDIIGILNSDDYYTSETVVEDIVAIITQQNADGAYADLNYIDANNTDKVVRKWRSGTYRPASFLWGWMPPHPTVFVTNKVYQQIGGFNISLRSAADYEFILRSFYKAKYKFAYLPKTIVAMRTGGISNASVKNRIQANREDRTAWRINDLKPYFCTLWLKPIRKIFQYL